MMNKRLALMVAGLALIGTPASAGWSGCYVRALGGAGSVNDKVTFTHGSHNLIDDGFGASGGSFGLGGGCDAQLSQKFIIGAFADYSWLTGMDSSVSLDNKNIVSISYKAEWTVGARAGYLITQDTLLYGLVGYTQMDSNDITIGKTPFSVPTFTGLALGGGLQTDIGSGFKLGAEYRWDQYDDQNIQLSKWDNLDLKPELQTVKLTLTYSFYGAPTEPPPPLK